jgi:hypothetical protein
MQSVAFVESFVPCVCAVFHPITGVLETIPIVSCFAQTLHAPNVIQSFAGPDPSLARTHSHLYSRARCTAPGDIRHAHNPRPSRPRALLTQKIMGLHANIPRRYNTDDLPQPSVALRSAAAAIWNPLNSVGLQRFPRARFSHHGPRPDHRRNRLLPGHAQPGRHRGRRPLSDQRRRPVLILRNARRRDPG